MRSASRAAVFAATVAAMSCTGASISFAAAAPETKASTSKNTFDNAQIARTALRYVGLWGGEACIDAHHDAFGQCKQFVNCVVSLASGGRFYPVDPGGDYQQSFADVGGVEVKAPNAVTGDIIQVGDHDDDTVLHTAIVLVNHHNGSFTVVDANYVGQPEVQEMVGVHEWTPPTGSHFWRLGSVSATLPADLAKAIKSLAKQSIPSVPQPPSLASTVPAGLASGTVPLTTVTPEEGSAATAERIWVDGHAFATYPVAALDPTVSLDTTKISDGVHHLRAQAITAFGAVSKLGPDLTLTVANKTAMIAALMPAGLASGWVTVGAAVSPPAAEDVLSVSVDGEPPAAPGLQFDASDLTPGAHKVALVATDANEKVVTTSPAVTVTTGPATRQRIAVDINGTGRSDLIALDSSSHIVRYPSTGDGLFGRAQVIDPAHSHGTVRLLAAGHFASADSPLQLLAVWSDGSAHLYTFDVDGTLDDDTLVGGTVAWATVSQLTLRDDGQLLAANTDGTKSVITFALAQTDPAAAAVPGTDAATDGGLAPGDATSGPAASGASGAPTATASPSGAASGGGTSAPTAAKPTGTAGGSTSGAKSTGAKASGKSSSSGTQQAAADAGKPTASGTPSANPSGTAGGSGAQDGTDAQGVVVTDPAALTPDPATVPGVIAVAVPLTPPAATPGSTSGAKTSDAKSDKAKSAASGSSSKNSSSSSSTTSSKASSSSSSGKSAKADAKPATPTRTAVNSVKGYFTSDGVLELLTTYSDGTSDIKPFDAPDPDAPVVEPVAAVFATIAVEVANAPLIHHMTALLSD